MSPPPSSHVSRLLDALEAEYGDSLRSCVEYTPTAERIHYLREDIDREAADARLVRIKQLYQAERLNADPITADPGLNRLHASVHVFDQAVIIHLIDHAGVVIGFSLDVEELPNVTSVTRYLEPAFGDVPATLDLTE